MKKIITLMLAVITANSFAQNALNYDGSNDYIQTTYSGVTGSADRTFEAWVYVGVTPTSNLCILDYGVSAVGSRNTWYINANRQLGFISGGTNANGSSSNNAIPIGQWAHVAFVLDSGTGYYYVDGVLVGTSILTTVNTPTTGTNLRIGQRVSGGSIPFLGVIDEIRIWDVARTQTEIQNNMNDEFCALPTGLVAYYKFNSGVAGGSNSSITTATDEVSANNGTLNNFALTGTSSNWVAGASLAAGSSTAGSATITSCGPFMSNTGHVWNTSGNYVDTITSPTGCDSLLNIALTVKPNSTNSISATGCNSYTSPSGNYVWTTSGTVYDTLPNSIGCDSILTIALTISVVDTAVLQNGKTLASYETGATYQWLDCNNNYAPIAGATSQAYTATANGSYAVEVDKNGCVDTSKCYSVTGFSVDENAFASQISVFPNPVKDVVRITIANNTETVSVDIVNVIGKTVATKSQSRTGEIALPINLPAGVYFVHVKAGNNSAIKKITVL